ncbi:helix-turn-helix domain-containing protein [Chryseobacterium wangxinyae]|uniref:helix-turn-helix domain-containing protein n=1 Tax=Chryseobacterium sp. CY353 TaxID=2997334 RepID=UPI002270B1A8|nr:AraC family transcriptional regulator [Chryseobacterium sp. CY353]MCY0969389.1 AraC family transcriptional regulator [Chryseobacterium sp. CY353]
MFPTISIADLINQPLNRVDFLIDAFQEMVEPENMVFPHRHNFYEIFWITKGNSRQTIDYKNYEIAEDSLFFISPGQLHMFEDWQGIEGYCILFTEAFFLQLFQNKNILFELSYLDNLYSKPFLKLNENAKKQLKPLVDLLFLEKYPENIQALLFVFLRKIQNLFSENETEVKSKNHLVIFKQFKNLIEENFNKNLSLSQYADQLHITRHQLNRIIKSFCNKTAGDLIKERIVLEAKQKLHFSEFTVSQIADQLGFEDSSYFARYFKKEVGISPIEFRKNKF